MSRNSNRQRQLTCIKRYYVPGSPAGYYIEEGEVLTLAGYFKGRPTLIPDVKKHPSEYDHLPHRTFVVFVKAEYEAHFKPRRSRRKGVN